MLHGTLKKNDDNTIKHCIYQKLTPTADADLTGYEDALDYVFDPDNKDIWNIAITGIFGSGKSSIINTYERVRKKRFIHISLSHFDGVNEEKEDTVLEKKIVNQLIQQVPGDSIPETKFKVKENYNRILYFFNALSFVVLLFLLVFFFSNIRYISCIIHSNTIPVPLVILFLLIISLSVSLIVQFIRFQKRSHFFNKIGYKDYSVEFDEYKDDKSYFNRHMDEIIYILENLACPSSKKIRFDGVIIEDLDRFKDSVDAKLFEKLRELCILCNYRINRDHANDYRPLRFFYLIRDDVFITKDRTKFFDYIIPVIPFVDSSNAYGRFKIMLQNTGCYEMLDDHFIRDLSLYFDDYRLMENIINEFQVYLTKINNIDLDYNKLLAIVVYKNYFPRDYADLQLQDGYVFRVFNKRNNMVLSETSQLKDEIADLNRQLDAMEQESLVSERELGIINTDRKNNPHLYLDKPYDEWYKNDFRRRLQAIKNNKEKNGEKIRSQIVDKETQIIHIRNKRFCEFITQDNEKEIFEIHNDEDLRTETHNQDNECLIQCDKYFSIIKYLIRMGYLDDFSYRDYMAYFDENGMSIKDKNFLIGVKNRDAKDFDYRLENIPLVYDYISNEEFLLPVIRNNYLIDYIIHENKQKAIDSFARQLKENKDIGFVGQFLRFTSNYDEVIKAVCNRWDDFLDSVISDDNKEMTLDEQQSVVMTALRVCEPEAIVRQNNMKTLSKYLSEKAKDISYDESVTNVIADHLALLGVEFINLDDQVASDSLRGLIIRNNSYEINFDNLESIILKDLQLTQEDIDKRFVSSLVNCNIEPVSTYAKDNLQAVVSVVVDNEWSQEDLPDIVISISTSELDEDLILGYLGISKTEIYDLNELDSKYWHVLAKKHTFSETEANVIVYFETFGLDESLILYLNNASIGEDLLLSNEKDVYVSLWKEAYKANSLLDDTYSAIVDEIGSTINNFDISNLEENKCHILLDHGLIKMDTVSIITFRNHYPNLLLDFIYANIDDYINLVRGQCYSIDEVNNLIEDSRISDEYKIRLLNMTADAISVKKKHLSDEVFKEVLANHFDINDLETLVSEYDTYDMECKDAIYERVMTNFYAFLKIANSCSKLLLSRIFEDHYVGLTDKSNVLDVLLQNKRYYSLIAKLLRSTGEEMIAKLFDQKRSRMSPVVKDEGHTQLLEVLKRHGIIEDYIEDEDGSHLRIKR